MSALQYEGAAQAALSPFATAAKGLLAAGYHPIPLMRGDKMPGTYVGGSWDLMTGWADFRDTAPSEFHLAMWSRYHDGEQGANIGIVTGTRVTIRVPGIDEPQIKQLVVIDYDVDDPFKLDMLLAALPPSPMQKRGARGLSAFYLADLDVRTRKYVDSDGRTTLVEILTGNSTRQTVCPPSKHPSGTTYTWLTAAGVVPIAELPVLTAEHFERLEEAAASIGWDPASVRASVDHAPVDGDEPTIWRQTNNCALEHLDDWVPELVSDFPNFRPTAGGYECVNPRREGGTQRPLHQRKSNLKLHRNGFKDMGSNETWTPLNFVMWVRGWDLDTAFGWLRNRLGLDDGLGDFVPRHKEQDDGSVIEMETGEVVGQAAVPATPEPAPAIPTVHSDELPDRLTQVPGLVGEVLQHIVDTSRKPNRVLALGSAIVTIGGIVGGRVAGPTRAGTHLFIAALGPTACGKDGPLRSPRRILGEIGLGRLKGAEQYSSAAAFYQILVNRRVSVSGIDEFGAFLARLHSRKVSTWDEQIKTVLRTAWGCNFDTMTTPVYGGKEEIEIESPSMSIFGVSTPDEFYQALQGRDVANGFMNRLLLIETGLSVKNQDPVRDDPNLPEELVQSLRELHEFADPSHGASSPLVGRIPPTKRLTWGPDAKAVALALEDWIEDHKYEPSAPFYGRTFEMAVRLATIMAAGRRSDTVDVEDIEWGRDLATWSAERMIKAAEDHMAETEHASRANRVMALLRKQGRVKMRDIIRHFGSSLSKRELTDVMVTLVESERVLQVEIKQGQTGPGKRSAAHFYMLP